MESSSLLYTYFGVPGLRQCGFCVVRLSIGERSEASEEGGTRMEEQRGGREMTTKIGKNMVRSALNKLPNAATYQSAASTCSPSRSTSNIIRVPVGDLRGGGGGPRWVVAAGAAGRGEANGGAAEHGFHGGAIARREEGRSADRGCCSW